MWVSCSSNSNNIACDYWFLFNFKCAFSKLDCYWEILLKAQPMAVLPSFEFPISSNSFTKVFDLWRTHSGWKKIGLLLSWLTCFKFGSFFMFKNLGIPFDHHFFSHYMSLQLSDTFSVFLVWIMFSYLFSSILKLFRCFIFVLNL